MLSNYAFHLLKTCHKELREVLQDNWMLQQDDVPL